MAFQQSPGSPQEIIDRCSAALDAIRESEVTDRQQAEIDAAYAEREAQLAEQNGWAR